MFLPLVLSASALSNADLAAVTIFCIATTLASKSAFYVTLTACVSAAIAPCIKASADFKLASTDKSFPAAVL